MPVSTALEIWVWMVAEIRACHQELSVRPGGSEGDTLSFRTRLVVLQRLKAAYEHYVENRGDRDRSWWLSLWRDGVDELGLAFFARHLTALRAFWTAEKKARGHVTEVACTAAVIEAVSALFYEKLGLSPEEVERRSADLLLDEDHRYRAEYRSRYGDCRLDRPGEGFLTWSEIEDRSVLYLHFRDQKMKEQPT